MSTDIKFQISGEPHGYAVPVIRAGVMHRIVGRWKLSGAYIRAVHDAIAQRRTWLSRLYDADAELFTKYKFVYARNCPPCGVTCAPDSQPCTFAYCPWCYGRRLAGWHQRLAVVVGQLEARRLPYFVATHKRVVGNETASHRIVSQQTAGAELARIVSRHVAEHLRIRNWLCSSPYYAVSWWCVEPVMFRTPSPDAIGFWRAISHTVFVTEGEMPKLPATDGVVKYEKDCFGSSLATLVGRTFRYPKYWYRGDAEVQSQLFRELRNRRLFSTTGTMRHLDGHSRRHVSTTGNGAGVE